MDDSRSLPVAERVTNNSVVLGYKRVTCSTTRSPFPSDATVRIVVDVSDHL